MPITKEKIIVTGDDRSKAMFKGIRRNTHALQKDFTGLLGTVGTLAGAYGLGRLVKSTLDAGDRIQKLSISTRLSTEFLSRMNHVAEISGTNLESVAKATQYLQKTSVDASDGLTTYQRAYEKLNINVQEFKDLSPEEQFLLITQRLGQMDNAAERTNIAMTLMGRGGKEMLQIMDGGVDSIRKLWQESDRMGTTLSRVQANDMAAMNDELTRLKGRMQGFSVDITTAMLPVLRNGAGLLQDFARALRGAVEPSDQLAAEFDDMSESGRVFLSVLTGVRNMAEEVARNASGVDADLFGMSADTLVQKGKELEEQISLIRQDIREAQQAMQQSGSLPYVGAQYKDMLSQYEADLKAKQEELRQVTAAYQFRQGLIDKSKGRSPTPALSPSGTGAGNASSETRAAAQATDQATASTNRYLEALKEEAATLGMTRREVQLYNMAKEGASDVDIRQAEAISTFLSASAELKQELDNRAQKHQNISASMDEEATKMAQVRDLSRQVGQSLSSGFENAILNGESLHSVIGGLLKDLERLALRAAISGIVNKIFPGAGSVLGGFLAEGGQAEKGKPYIVGERGPELFVPDIRGQVISHDEMTRSVVPYQPGPSYRGTAGQGQYTITNYFSGTFTIDARNAVPGTEDRIKQAIITEVVPQVIQASKKSTIELLRRPSFA